MSGKIDLVEVGVRDGLQNEKDIVSTATKIEFIHKLVTAGIQTLELGSFVRPDLVPQMADTEALYEAIASKRLNLKRTEVLSLVPNLKGMERALKVKTGYIAVFTAASETFNQKNINRSIAQSLIEITEVVKLARKNKIKVRGYVSTAFGCPFEGKISAKQTLKVVSQLFKAGVGEVSIGDTIGVAQVKELAPVIKPALKNYGSKRIALHFHDTRGMASANALRSIELGVRRFDASAGGLGGCPFAPGATGNLATEDFVFLCEGLGLKTGIDLEKLCEASLWLAKTRGKPVQSRYLAAYQSACARESSRVSK